MNQFKLEYATVIEKGLKKEARFMQMVAAQEKIRELKLLYTPLFLRRTKKEIFQVKSAELSEGPLLANEMPIKTDLVVWIPLNEI